MVNKAVILEPISNESQLDIFADKPISLQERKKLFLDSIRSNNSKKHYKYKRVVVSPIRYAGGKSLGVGFIIELLPNDIRRVISPFMGGGSIEIVLSKYLELEVVVDCTPKTGQLELE